MHFGWPDATATDNVQFGASSSANTLRGESPSIARNVLTWVSVRAVGRVGPVGSDLNRPGLGGAVSRATACPDCSSFPPVLGVMVMHGVPVRAGVHPAAGSDQVGVVTRSG